MKHETGRFLISGSEVEMEVSAGHALMAALSAVDSLKTQLLQLNGVIESSNSGEPFDLDNFRIEDVRHNFRRNIQIISESALNTHPKPHNTQL